jgi:two-component system OmpR family response regulator
LKRILIVDDEKDLCEIMRSFLISKGYDVDCANNLREAHMKWDKDPPALVLLDNNLPDGLGLDMLEANYSLLDNTRVIMMTADIFVSNRERAKKLGIDLFLQKPFSLLKFLEMIQQTI